MKSIVLKVLCAVFFFVQITPVWSAEEVRAVASRGTEPRVIKTSGGTISMDLVDAALEDVLKLLSQQANLNFVAAQPVRDKRVTVYMDQVPVQTAIRSLLDANSLTFHPIEGSDVFIVTESGARPIKLVTKVYTLSFARVLPTINESSSKFGATGSLITTSFSGSQGSGSSGSSGSSSGAGGGPQGGGSSGEGEEATSGIVAVIRQMLTDRGSATSDPRTNSIIVTDVAESIAAVDAVVAKLDIKPAQVYLEAEVLEVSLSTLKRLGIEYGSSTGQLATFTGPSRKTDFPLGPTLLKHALNGVVPTQTLSTLNLSDLSAVFKALATDSDTKFLASPRLMTLSNEVAEVRIVAEAATGQNSVSQNDTGTVTTEVERNTVGTILRITPLVTENKYVTMVIEPEVSRVIDSPKFASFLDPNRRSARTTVMVENGGTALIAGLISHEKENSKRKIPFFGDIPFFGAGFRRSDNEETKTEIVIFVTPRIVSTEGPVPSSNPMTVPMREQSPLSSKEHLEHRKYRSEIMRQKSIQETLDLLAKP